MMDNYCRNLSAIYISSFNIKFVLAQNPIFLNQFKIMRQLLSFVEAYWRSLGASEAAGALALSLGLLLALSAAVCHAWLRAAADTKIDEIGRSSDREIWETKHRKELLRAERMAQIRAKLAERIREMLRVTQCKIERRRRGEELSEHNGGLLRIPIRTAGSPARGPQHQRFNSFVAPAHGLCASIVETMPLSGKKFASSQKKSRLGQAAVESSGPPSAALDTSYQVSMPSALRRRLEIRSYHEARDKHFADGWRDHTASSQRRSTIRIVRSVDQHGQPILQFMKPHPSQYRFRIFSMFSPVEKESQEISAAFRAKMAQILGRSEPWFSCRPLDGGLSGLHSGQIGQRGEPIQVEQEESCGQILQGDYLSPEQVSLACSRSSPDKQTQRSSPEEPGNPRLSLQRCPEASPTEDEQELQERSAVSLASQSCQRAPESRRRVPTHQGAQQQPAGLLSTSMAQIAKPGPSTPMKENRRLGLSPSVSSASPSLASTLHGLASSHRRKEELQAVHDLLLLRQRVEPALGSSRAKRQVLPRLDFGKIEELRQQDLASEESSHEAPVRDVRKIKKSYESPPSADQKRRENQAEVGASQSQAAQSRPDCVFLRRQGNGSGSGITWRSQSQKPTASKNEHLAVPCGHHLPRFGGRAATMGVSVPQTPELVSYTQSLERTSQSWNPIDQQEQPNPEAFDCQIVDHTNKEDAASFGLARLKRPFDYASRNGEMTLSLARSQPVLHQSRLEKPLYFSHKMPRTQINDPGQDPSREPDQEQSHEYSHSITPKDSFVYSNSTQTAAQNSQGPLQSAGKSLTVVKSPPTNNLDGQSGYIGSFLTQNDLQFGSVKGSYSIQSNTHGGPSPLPTAKHPATFIPTGPFSRPTSPFLLPAPSPLHTAELRATAHVHSNSVNHDQATPTMFHESGSNAVSYSSQSSSSLQAHLGKKTMIIQNLRGVCGKQELIRGTVIAPIDEVKVEYFSEEGEHQRPSSSSPPKDSGQKGRQEGSHQSQEEHGQSNAEKSGWVQECSFVVAEDENGAGEVRNEPLEMPAEQRVDALNEGNFSSRHNLQSISFNISSSRQSSPTNHFVSVMKLASSYKLSQKSIGPSTEAQAVPITGPSRSPTASLPDSCKTPRSATATGQGLANRGRGPSTAAALSPTESGLPASSPLGAMKQGEGRQHPHFDIAKSHSKSGVESSFAWQRPPRLQPAFDPRRMAKQGGLSEDLMAKVRKRKTQILRAGHPQGGSMDQQPESVDSAAEQAQPLRDAPPQGPRNNGKRLDFNAGRAWQMKDSASMGQGHDNQSGSWRCYSKPALSPQQPLSSPNFTPTKHNPFSNPQNQGKTLAFTSQSRDNQAEDRSHQSTVNPFTHHDDADNDTPSVKKSDRHKGKASPGSFESPSKSRAPLFARGQHLQTKKANPFSAEHYRNGKKQHGQQKFASSRSQESRAANEKASTLRFQVDEGDEELRLRQGSGSGSGQGQPRRRAPQRNNKNQGGHGEATDGSARTVEEGSPAASPSKKKPKEQLGSHKKNKSGEKKAQAKRQLPPLAQRKSKSTKSGSMLSRSSPAKPGGHNGAMTAEQKSQQMKELNQKLAVIKKKQFQLPLSSTLKQNSGSNPRPSSLRAQQPKGKLLEVVSKPSYGMAPDNSAKANHGGSRNVGLAGGGAAQDRSSLPAKPLVWSLSRTSSTVLKRQPKLGSGFTFGRKPLQSFSRLNQKADTFKQEEEKESLSHHLASPKSCGLSSSLQPSRTALKRSGSSVEASPEPQSTPQATLRRKLQQLKQKGGTITSLSSSNQSDNQSTYTDDANELMELQQYFEAHDERLRSRSTAASSIEAHIVRTIKTLGETHYLPVQHVQASHYLAGVKIVHCEMVGEEVLVRVGGGYESLKHYVRSNSRNFQRQITTAMKKSGQGIGWVVDQLVQGQKHKMTAQTSGVVAPAVTSPGRGRFFPVGTPPLPSPTSVPSVPHAKIGGNHLPSNQYLLSQSMRQDSSAQLARVPRSGSIRLPRSPAAAGLRLNSPLDLDRPKDR